MKARALKTLYYRTLLLTSLAANPLLAAGNKGSRQFGSRNQVQETPLNLMALVAVLGGMVALVFVAWAFSAWQKRREGRVLNSPRALFRELCGAHGLIRADRDLLYEIAQWHEIADPVQLFVEPQRFHAAEMHTALDCESEARELHSRLFAVEAAAEQAAPTANT